MSLFGGLDLGSPAERNRQALTNELEVRRSRWARPGYFYRGGGDLLLRHGHFYPGRAIPLQYAHLMGPESRCFMNALDAAEADPSLRYCEGLYATGFGFPTLHAWCLDPTDSVVEVTVPTTPDLIAIMTASDTGLPFLPPEHWGYYGAVFTTQYARAHMMETSFSLPMFERSSHEREPDYPGHDFPVLRLPYDPNRTELS